jgi:hypothetical protein
MKEFDLSLTDYRVRPGHSSRWSGSIPMSVEKRGLAPVRTRGVATGPSTLFVEVIAFERIRAVRVVVLWSQRGSISLGGECFSKGLAGSWQAGFVAETLAEIPDDVEPDLGAAVQPIQDWWCVLRDVSRLPRFSADDSAGPIEQLQVIVQRHRQTAFVARSSICRFLSDCASRWLER